MEFSDQEKQLLDMAQQLLWRKGVNNPMESQIANALTQLAKKIIESDSAMEPKE